MYLTGCRMNIGLNVAILSLPNVLLFIILISIYATYPNTYTITNCIIYRFCRSTLVTLVNDPEMKMKRNSKIFRRILYHFIT